MARIRVRAVLVKEVTMEEAKSFNSELRGNEGAIMEIGDILAEGIDMDWDEVEVDVLDDDGREI